MHAYEEHGLDCVRHLNGIFAFALWDDREERLVAARDAFGVKPLYWWSDGRRVALASEIGALLAAGLVPAEVDRVALDHYLACRFVPSPRTLFEGVHKLPAASTLVVEDGGAPRVTELARAARRAARRARRRRARRPARRALHRRRRAPDDVRRPVRRLPLRRRGQRGRGRRDEAARSRPADHLHDRLPRPRRRGGRAQARGGDGARDRHRPPRHRHARDRLPHRARAHACRGSRSRAGSRAPPRCSSSRASRPST